jgi:Trypsin-co-occurring domain 2
VTEEEEGLGLADAIDILRAEFIIAVEQAVNHTVQFPVQSVTVELIAVTKKSKDGKAGFKVPLIGAEIGGGMGRASESTQKVTVSFGSPIDRNGKVIKLAGRSSDKDE